jgi:hypothetical protein
MQTTLHTNGRGYWSRTAKAVNVYDMRVRYINDEQDFGELCVYFTEDSWDVDTMGLIYTDKQFMQQLKEFLATKGFTADELKCLSYSEQGMQGDNFVSMDLCSTAIIKRFANLGMEAINA